MVTAACSSAQATSGVHTLYDVFARGFRFHGLPSSLKSGAFAVAFSNREPFPITHEMILVSLPAGQSAQDVVRAAQAKGTGSEGAWLHWGEIDEVDTGSTHVGLFDLPPGIYALACWQTGTGGRGTGPPHAALGMVFDFTVSS
jgi:hypothetical protein